MSFEERIRKLAEKWFVCEPPLFAAYCIHRLIQNGIMGCPIRVGKGRLEYNPNLLNGYSDLELEQTLAAEMIRVLLKHPYGRQPQGIHPTLKKIASDCVLSDAYSFSEIGLHRPDEFELPNNQSFEYYAQYLKEEFQTESFLRSEKLLDKIGEKQILLTDREDSTGLWEEDEMMEADINQKIEKTTRWGSIHGLLKEKIRATLKGKIDYRKILNGFRANMLTSDRSLTRMRPNRRRGFEQMGSRYKFSTNLLCAVDVSGSMSKETLGKILSVLNKAFRYGIKQLDVIQFDTQIIGNRIQMKHAITELEIHGRGGTDFQNVIEYTYKHPEYDGLIILTDGYATQPKIPDQFPKLLWVLPEEKNYETHHKWMENSGRVVVIK